MMMTQQYEDLYGREDDRIYDDSASCTSSVTTSLSDFDDFALGAEGDSQLHIFPLPHP